MALYSPLPRSARGATIALVLVDRFTKRVAILALRRAGVAGVLFVMFGGETGAVRGTRAAVRRCRARGFLCQYGGEEAI